MQRRHTRFRQTECASEWRRVCNTEDHVGSERRPNEESGEWRDCWSCDAYPAAQEQEIAEMEENYYEAAKIMQLTKHRHVQRQQSTTARGNRRRRHTWRKRCSESSSCAENCAFSAGDQWGGATGTTRAQLAAVLVSRTCMLVLQSHPHICVFWVQRFSVLQMTLCYSSYTTGSSPKVCESTYTYVYR